MKMLVSSLVIIIIIITIIFLSLPSFVRLLCFWFFVRKELIFERSQYCYLQISYMQQPYTHLVPELKGVDPDDAFSIVPYEKGSNLLMYLEQKLGGAGQCRIALCGDIV